MDYQLEAQVAGIQTDAALQDFRAAQCRELKELRAILMGPGFSDYDTMKAAEARIRELETTLFPRLADTTPAQHTEGKP